MIDAEWKGPAPPVAARLAVRHRAASDLSPLDIADPAERLRLKSYVWADQPDRLARFDGAVALALAAGVRVERADAAEWLAAVLPRRAGDAATVVYTRSSCSTRRARRATRSPPRSSRPAPTRRRPRRSRGCASSPRRCWAARSTALACCST